MPSMIRRLVDLLGRDGLTYLQEQRQLGPRRDNDERRKALARSYRGDIEAFLEDLRQRELLELLDRDFILAGELYQSQPLRSLGREDLLRIARKLFVRRQIPSDFVRDDASHAFVLDGPNDEVGSDDADDTEPPREAETAGSPLDEDPEGNGGSLLERIGESWSRPRKISTVMRSLGLEVPDRLRTERFQDVVKLLESRGLQAQLADGEGILTANDESPGIRAKLRLRLALGAQAHVPGGATSPVLLTFPIAGRQDLATLRCSRSPGQGGASTPDQRFEGTVQACYEIVSRHLASDRAAAEALRTCELVVNIDGVDQPSALPRLPIALVLLAAATGRTPVEGLIAIGDLSLDGLLLSRGDISQVLAVAASAGFRVALLAAEDAERLSEPGLWRRPDRDPLRGGLEIQLEDGTAAPGAAVKSRRSAPSATVEG